jgi:hypothetical protein
MAVMFLRGGPRPTRGDSAKLDKTEVALRRSALGNLAPENIDLLTQRAVRAEPLDTFERPDWARDEDRAMRNAAFEIVSRFPPSQYVYVPVGSSPAPMTALLVDLSQADVFDLPVSGLRRVQFGNSMEGLEERLNQGGRDALRERFADFLPSERLRSGRALLLIDYVNSGDTLSLLRRELLSAYAGRGVRVEAVGLGTPIPNPPDWLHSLDSLKTHRAIEERFRTHAYRPVAVRGHRPFWEEPPQRMGSHLGYRLDMQKQLVAEPAFRAVLAESLYR